jgi:transcriptional regulator with XRE-family HTH domain
MARVMAGAGPDPDALTAREFVMTRFAANLVRCRREADMSQDEVALRASLNRTEVSSLERALRSPRVETVVKLAGALEVDPGRLFEGLAWQPGEYRWGRFREVTAGGPSASNGREG